MRILVHRYGQLGDTIFMTSLLPGLLQQFPGASIDLSVAQCATGLFAGDDRVERIFAHSSMGLPLAFSRSKQQLFVHSIRQPYDLFINLDTAKKSQRLARWVRAKQKIGPPFHDIHFRDDKHAVDTYRELYSEFIADDFMPACVPSLKPSDDQTVLNRLNIDGPYIVLSPCNSTMHLPEEKNYRAWPKAHWQGLLELLSKQCQTHTIVIIGQDTPNERAYIEALEPYPARVVSLLGKTNLMDMMRVVQGADLMITTDTGTIHVAAALNTPLIGLYGPTIIDDTGPYLSPSQKNISQILVSDRACQPCYGTPMHQQFQCPKNLCMYDLTPERVVRQAKVIIAG